MTGLFSIHGLADRKPLPGDHELDQAPLPAAPRSEGFSVTSWAEATVQPNESMPKRSANFLIVSIEILSK